jgi:hypothetical protein
MSLFTASTKNSSPTERHTFLMGEGRWKLEGYWLLKPDGDLVPVHGKLIVAWNAEDWFNIVGKVCLAPSPEIGHPFDETTFQYRGHFSAADQFTFMLQHSRFGQIEGQGWILPDSILQRFWILGDHGNRTGLDRLYRVDAEHYHWSSSIMGSHTLISTMEVMLKRLK